MPAKEEGRRAGGETRRHCESKHGESNASSEMGRFGRSVWSDGCCSFFGSGLVWVVGRVMGAGDGHDCSDGSSEETAPRRRIAGGWDGMWRGVCEESMQMSEDGVEEKREKKREAV